MDLEQISFHIISYAGDSFSQMREALSEAKQGNFERSEELMASAKKMLNDAHNTHTEIIVAEAKGEKSEYSVLLSHAQDTLMNTILAETLIEELIEVYKNK
ncbi:MAG: PTS lactose/cellobiose transporter subunit IIA [Sebaldella sp.]|nr:PTS lactose/cellobiose transporter subunit IIA [Sebaldella sp.]